MSQISTKELVDDRFNFLLLYLLLLFWDIDVFKFLNESLGKKILEPPLYIHMYVRINVN
jgi:hypothetical protein